jgi:hypothetical protein
MATSRPFAYNTGAPISGTDQVGTIAIGTPDVGFDYSGVQWWNGPDESIGYVIAKPNVNGDQHTPISGVFAYIAFRRSATLTEASFLEEANNLTGQNFTTGDDAKTWLNDNGYWTSWGSVSFTIATADISNLLGAASGITTNGLLGYISAGNDNIVNQLVNYELTSQKSSEITNLFIANSLGTNADGYIFNVTWGAGSSISTGLVRIGVNSSYNQFLISAVDTAYNDWYLNSGPGNPVNPSLAGTFYFPATFTLHTPLIQSESNYWC